MHNFQFAFFSASCAVLLPLSFWAMLMIFSQFLLPCGSSAPPVGRSQGLTPPVPGSQSLGAQHPTWLYLLNL